MRTPIIAGFLTGLVLLAPAAFAENLTGTIVNVDRIGEKITLLRADTGERVDVSVSDRNSLAALRTGSNITLDAQRQGSGFSWQGRSITPGVTGTTTASSDAISDNTAISRGVTTTAPAAAASTFGTGAMSGGSSGVGSSSVPAGVSTTATTGLEADASTVGSTPVTSGQSGTGSGTAEAGVGTGASAGSTS